MCLWPPGADRFDDFLDLGFEGSHRIPIAQVGAQQAHLGAISANNLTRIFEPFERIGVSSVSGSGLGMAIVQAGVEAMAGTVDVASEPGAGTDLASLRTTAVRDGDDYVINGQKMWTSLIAYADYVWLAARTNPEAKKHRGISMLIVPTTAEGFSWTPVHTMAGVDTSATYYQDVRVPVTSLVGEENAGWKLVTNQLNHERVALVSAQPIFLALGGVREWAQNTKDVHGKRLIDSEWVQLNLARVHAKAEVLKLINWELASASGTDSDASPSPADASAAKVYGTELATEAYRLLMEVLGTAATLRTDSAGALLRGRIERMHRSCLILTFGGGTNEIQRDIIGMVALGLPRVNR